MCSELRDEILEDEDGVSPSDSDATDRGTFILRKIQQLVMDLYGRRKWRFRKRTTTLSFSSGVADMPSDFGELGPYGRIYETATGDDLDETDETEITLLRARLSTRTDVYSLFGQNTTTGALRANIPYTGSFGATMSYLMAPPTLDYSSNDDKLKIAVPAAYHELVLVPGLQWKLGRNKGSRRSTEYQAEYLEGVRLMANMEKQKRTSARLMPTFSGR